MLKGKGRFLTSAALYVCEPAALFFFRCGKSALWLTGVRLGRPRLDHNTESAAALSVWAPNPQVEASKAVIVRSLYALSV